MYEDDVDLDQNGGDGCHLLSVEPMYIVHVDHVGDDYDGNVIECMRMMMVTF